MAQLPKHPDNMMTALEIAELVLPGLFAARQDALDAYEAAKSQPQPRRISYFDNPEKWSERTGGWLGGGRVSPPVSKATPLRDLEDELRQASRQLCDALKETLLTGGIYAILQPTDPMDDYLVISPSEWEHHNLKDLKSNKVVGGRLRGREVRFVAWSRLNGEEKKQAGRPRHAARQPVLAILRERAAVRITEANPFAEAAKILDELRKRHPDLEIPSRKIVADWISTDFHQRK